jgi:hypothetical protein
MIIKIVDFKIVNNIPISSNDYPNANCITCLQKPKIWMCLEISKCPKDVGIGINRKI